MREGEVEMMSWIIVKGMIITFLVAASIVGFGLWVESGAALGELPDASVNDESQATDAEVRITDRDK